MAVSTMVINDTYVSKSNYGDWHFIPSSGLPIMSVWNPGQYNTVITVLKNYNLQKEDRI